MPKLTNLTGRAFGRADRFAGAIKRVVGSASQKARGAAKRVVGGARRAQARDEEPAGDRETVEVELLTGAARLSVNE